MSFIRQLKARMILEGKTPYDLCEATGMDRATWYRRLSRDGMTFTAEELIKIAEALNLPWLDFCKFFLPIDLQERGNMRENEKEEKDADICSDRKKSAEELRLNGVPASS